MMAVEIIFSYYLKYKNEFLFPLITASRTRGWTNFVNFFSIR